MATPVTEVVKINWQQVFPWLALFRAVGLALHVRQVFVGAIAAGLIALGHWCVLGSHPPWLNHGVGTIPDNPLFWVWAPLIDMSWPLLPYSTGFAANSWQRHAGVMAVLAWGLVIGGLAGGILVRRAAFEFARDEPLSLSEAMRYVWKRCLDYLSAPALPLSVVLEIGALLTLLGWIAIQLPGASTLISGIWLIVFIGGIVMAAMLGIVLAGWPMMVAAVSVNGGDGFDALSRGFGFVIDRWRYYAWCLGVMTVQGGIGGWLLFALVRWADYLIRSSFALGSGQSMPVYLPRLPPIGAWDFCLNLVAAGLAYSYFWSSMTIIYLVLRKSVDNAEMQDIHIEGGPRAPDDLRALLNPQIPAAPTLLPIIDPPPNA